MCVCVCDMSLLALDRVMSVLVNIVVSYTTVTVTVISMKTD